MSTNTDRKQTMLLTNTESLCTVTGQRWRPFTQKQSPLLSKQSDLGGNATEENQTRKNNSKPNDTVCKHRQTDGRTNLWYTSLQAGERERTPPSTAHCKTLGRQIYPCRDSLFLGFIFYSGTFHDCMIILKKSITILKAFFSTHRTRMFHWGRFFLKYKLCSKFDLQASAWAQSNLTLKKIKSYCFINVLLTWTS